MSIRIRSAGHFLLGPTLLLICLLAGMRAPLAAQTADSSFSLERGDIVRTYVWREKDLSSDTLGFMVDESGRLTLPMLGAIQVLGRPWSRLRDSLIAEYYKQLKNPSIILTPMRRVQVLGEVTRPGQYYAEPTLSIAGLVALAGGANPSGDLRRIRIVREGRVVAKDASVESLLLRGTFHSGDQIFVDRRSWFERNTAIVASTLISAAGIIVTILNK